MGDEAKAPHRKAEQRKTEHNQPAGVEFARRNDVDGHSDERGRTGRVDRNSGLPGAEPAHIAEKQRGQVDRGKDADAGDKGQKAAERKVAVAERPQIDDRAREGLAADHEQNAGDRRHPSAGPDCRIVEPVPARPVFEHVFEGAGGDRHQRRPTTGSTKQSRADMRSCHRD